MDKVQKITKAKMYLELMARSIDPITQEVIHDSILQRQEIKETFLYVVSLLNDLIENGGEALQVAEPAEFQVDKINKDKIIISDLPIQIAGFIKRINKQIKNNKMKTLKQSVLVEWLIKNDYLIKDKREVSRYETVYKVTPLSQSIGIIEEELVDEETGEVKTAGVKLTKTAQEFILDNLENIVGADEEALLPVSDEVIDEHMVGQKWSAEEEERLIYEFTKENLTIQHIASLHHRKEGGIRARLKKLGLIEDN